MRTGDLISGKYRLLERLGEGGMGEVWSAVNELTNRHFAIKLLLPARAPAGPRARAATGAGSAGSLAALGLPRHNPY